MEELRECHGLLVQKLDRWRENWQQGHDKQKQYQNQQIEELEVQMEAMEINQQRNEFATRNTQNRNDAIKEKYKEFLVRTEQLE